MLRRASAEILYAPGHVRWVSVMLEVTSQIEAYSFVTRTCHSLLSRSYYLEVSRESIRIYKRVTCREVGRRDLASLVREVLGEVGDSCTLRFSGSYSLRWYRGDPQLFPGLGW